MLSNIVESLTESGGHGLSEHGYLGQSSPTFVPPKMAYGKALQTHLTLPKWLVTRAVLGTIPGQPEFPTVVLPDNYNNVAAWVNGFDLSKLAWDTAFIGTWLPGSMSATPDNPDQTGIDSTIGEFEPLYEAFTGHLYVNPWTGVYTPPAAGYVGYISISAILSAQIGIVPGSYDHSAYPSAPTGYMVIAVDNATGIAVAGCSSDFEDPLGTYIISLPPPYGFTPSIPPYGHDASVGTQIFFALIGPTAAGVSPQMFPDLTTFVSQIRGEAYYPGGPGWDPIFIPAAPLETGPDWNDGLACLVPSGPPFA